MLLILKKCHPGVVLSMFFNLCQISGSCFYETVLMKKSVFCKTPPGYCFCRTISARIQFLPFINDIKDF